MPDDGAPEILESEDVFDRVFTGSFGRYFLKEGVEVNYLLSSLRVRDIEKLQTAADAFSFDDVSFEEMMQRDIDYTRVKEEIVDGYLKRSKDAVIFFPPIIVSVVPVGSDDRPIRTALGRTEENYRNRANTQLGYIQWGATKFELELPVVTRTTGYSIAIAGDEVNFVNYAARLRINSDEVKLVVIDGQHRFVALQQLLATEKEAVERLELPVCFVFSPNAVEGRSESDAVRAFRNMFVTINNEAKKVSGHFITLLKDRSISATIIRQLAQHWKDAADDALTSYLQMLEWNERQDNLANQRRRSFSITSVGILNMALTRLLYRPINTRAILGLSAIREELESGETYTPYSKIWDEGFEYAQHPAIRKRVNETMVPALSILFQQLTPYREQWNRYQNALNFLNKQVERGIRGYAAYRDNVLARFRLTNVLDDQDIKLAEEKFEDQVEIPEDQETFFLNVFQQALIRCWADIHERVAAEENVDHQSSAEAVAGAIDKSCCSNTSLFDRERIFVRYTLFQDGGRPQTSDVAKSAWKSYVAGTILNDTAFVEIEKWITREYPERAAEIRENLQKYLREQVEEYIEELRKRTGAFVRKNWEFGPFDPDRRDELLELRARAHRDEEAADKFDKGLAQLSEEYFLDAKRKYIAATKVSASS